MSELRTIKIPIDISLLKEVAHELNWKVEENAPIYGFSTKNFIGEVVLKPKTSPDIGVVKGKLVYDSTAHKNAELLMKKYYYYLLRKKGLNVHMIENDSYVMYAIKSI
jgi:hypothetical protein